MKESTRQRRAFDQYVRLGSHRSLQELYELLRGSPALIGLERGPSLSTIESWSSGFHWQDRLQDLERQARERDAEEHLNALRDMKQRHVKEGLALQQKGIERLNQLSPDDLPASDAIRAVLEGVRLERLARGEPTEHIRQEGISIYGHIDLGGFSYEELRRLAETARRNAAGDSAS